ncbi:MAG: hypothetical protein SGJ09_09555 [Phycisphaerae bacterium]|nr:hypothetical protein [Phycisphaerae bacterium]
MSALALQRRFASVAPSGLTIAAVRDAAESVRADVVLVYTASAPLLDVATGSSLATRETSESTAQLGNGWTKD